MFRLSHFEIWEYEMMEFVGLETLELLTNSLEGGTKPTYWS